MINCNEGIVHRFFHKIFFNFGHFHDRHYTANKAFYKIYHPLSQATEGADKKRAAEESSFGLSPAALLKAL
jgi:hypothetical protein